VRDTLPRNELGKPIFFATGVMLSVLVILLISVA
jgi:hypothetical protein